MTLARVALAAAFALGAAPPLHATTPLDTARAQLLTVLAAEPPAAVPDAATTARISAAADELERLAGTPDLRAQGARLDGVWLTRFSSQGVFGEIDVAFMTRALPGGGAPGGKARVLQVLQELQPSKGFYRNTLVLEVGAERVPVLYFATAELSISAQRPNDLEVSFRRIEFVPGRADVSIEQVRSALALAPATPLAIDVPAHPARPASVSTVTYLDESLRINRGKDYVAVLEKLR